MVFLQEQAKGREKETDTGEAEKYEMRLLCRSAYDCVLV